MKESLRWLGHTLQMKDGRLPKIVLFGQPSGATRNAGCPCLGWEDVINKDLKRMGTSWEGVKREALNRLGWRRSHAQLCWPQAAWCCSELLVVVVVNITFLQWSSTLVHDVFCSEHFDNERVVPFNSVSKYIDH